MPLRREAVRNRHIWLTGIGGALALAAWLSATPAMPQDRATLAAQGQALFASQGCYGCHTIGPAGTPIGPDLSRAGRKYGEASLARWLSDPQAQRPMRHMPELALSEGEARALAAYLASLP